MKKFRILITGSSGMVGRNICEHPSSACKEIITPSSTELNLLDPKTVDSFISEYRPDLVIHCAGVVGGIQANIRHPVRFLVSNLDMGKNIVMSAYKNGVRKLLNLGSSCVYPRNSISPLKESNLLQGELEPTNEGYAIAKIATAKLCEYINLQTGSSQYKTLIPCNLYGRYDKFDPAASHMVPAIIHKLYQAKVKNLSSVEIWGDGSARREFMYAGDLADCIWRCVEHFDSLPQNMNVGMSRDWSINEYYQYAANIVGYTGSFTHDLSKPVGMKRKLVDSSLLTRWGWKPKTDLNKGLEATYQYYLESIKNESI